MAKRPLGSTTNPAHHALTTRSSMPHPASVIPHRTPATRRPTRRVAAVDIRSDSFSSPLRYLQIFYARILRDLYIAKLTGKNTRDYSRRPNYSRTRDSFFGCAGTPFFRSAARWDLTRRIKLNSRGTRGTRGILVLISRDLYIAMLTGKVPRDASRTREAPRLFASSRE